MKRVLILGRGAAGKSTLARRLGTVTGLPVVELDERFWQPGLAPTAPEDWAAVQRDLSAPDMWILDGDLGPHDVLNVRLRDADTVIVLDFSLFRCAVRALRRAPERMGFWRWLIGYRRQSLPLVMSSIATRAGRADVHVLRTPRAVRRFLDELTAQYRVVGVHLLG